MFRRSLHLLAAAALVAGCANNQKQGLTVSDLETARLPPGTSEQWQEEQLEVLQAREEAARAELAINDAERDLEVARSEVNVAKSQIDQAEKQLEAAQKTRDDQAAQQAQQQLDFFRQKQRVAETHVEAEQQQVQLSKTRQELAETRQQLAQLRLNQARFEALQQANDPAAQNYSAQEFDEAVARQQDQLARLRSDVELQQSQYTRARNEWQQQLQQLEAGAPGTPAG